jgi:putative hemolysin
MSAVLDRIAAPSAPVRHGERVLARAGDLEVVVATDPATLEAAFRLRHEVFVGELGARLNSVQGIDRDLFDAWCTHLVLRDVSRDEVVGTYRVLLPEQAQRLGRLYAEQEFWLTRLLPIREELVELGRSCIAKPWRGGAALMLLWSGIGELLSGTGLRYVMGCVSVSMADGGVQAARLYRKLEREASCPEPFRVWPRDRLPIESLLEGAGDAQGPVLVPPLVKGYLRAGAGLMGEPHRDFEFGCADFPMMLDLEALDARYQKRFLP